MVVPQAPMMTMAIRSIHNIDYINQFQIFMAFWIIPLYSNRTNVVCPFFVSVHILCIHLSESTGHVSMAMCNRLMLIMAKQCQYLIEIY